MTSEEKVDARVQAKLNMYDYAIFVETDPWCELVHSEPPFFDSSFVQPGRANGPYQAHTGIMGGEKHSTE